MRRACPADRSAYCSGSISELSGRSIGGTALKSSSSNTVRARPLKNAAFRILSRGSRPISTSTAQDQDHREQMEGDETLAVTPYLTEVALKFETPAPNTAYRVLAEFIGLDARRNQGNQPLWLVFT